MATWQVKLLLSALVIGLAQASESANETKKDHHHKRAHNLTEDKVGSNATEIQDYPDEGWEYENTSHVDTRRILYGKMVKPGKRPYMVYLQLTKESAKAHKYRGWLCAGVIVHPSYVLTSAACVEDAEHFYIVSGTTKFVDSFDYQKDECVCNHRRKVTWKCIPKNYKFDFADSIKWSSNDIAIVKVDKPFKFGVCEKGCEFATDLVCYNNISRELEKPNTKGYIAGWGSTGNFREGVYRRQQNGHQNSKCLQEAKVCIMDNEACAKKWAQKFRQIINEYMVCTKDVMKKLSELCDKKYANCTDTESRRQVVEELPSNSLNVDLGRHLRDPDDYTARRSSIQGGFCENDHGGPLIVKYQGKERVVGVISACKIDPKSHSCHGPFLYTSVYKNRQFISCSINKDVEDECRRVFRTGVTHEEIDVNWDNVHEDEVFKANGDDSSDSSDDDAALRTHNADKAVETKPEPKEEKKEDKKEEKKESSSSSASVEVQDKKSEVKKSEEKKSEEKKEEKPHKKHIKRSKGSSEHEGNRRDSAGSYISSREDDVNEPSEE